MNFKYKIIEKTWGVFTDLGLCALYKLETSHGVVDIHVKEPDDKKATPEEMHMAMQIRLVQLFKGAGLT